MPGVFLIFKSKVVQYWLSHIVPDACILFSLVKSIVFNSLPWSHKDGFCPEERDLCACLSAGTMQPWWLKVFSWNQAVFLFSPDHSSNAKLKLQQPHESALVVIQMRLKYGPGALKQAENPTGNTWKWVGQWIWPSNNLHPTHERCMAT